jgi:hypothetical protein
MNQLNRVKRLLAKAQQDEFEAVRFLTPFAVDYRYELLDEEEAEFLDRPAVREQIVRLRSWVEQYIRLK